MMGYGDDSAQSVSLWRGMTFPPHGPVPEERVPHELEYIEVHYMQTLLWFFSEGRGVPASLQHRVCVVGESVWPRSGSRTDGWAEGLAEVSSSLSLIICLTSPPRCKLLWLVCVCVCVVWRSARAAAMRKAFQRSLCVGNPDKPKHNTTHCSSVMCSLRVFCLRM